MCGIAGKVSWAGNNSFEMVRSMTNALIHRGPDSGVVKKFGNATLGHRRLRIIDLNEKADQPMVDPETGLVLVFNGEIYNYKEIREKLLKKLKSVFSVKTPETLHGTFK